MKTHTALQELLRRHFDNPEGALSRLEKYLTEIELPFDLNLRLRKLDFPSQFNICRRSHWVYYYVAGTKFGTVKEGSSLDPNSAFNSADGYGLNLGCPVRLLRALDALNALNPIDQEDSRNRLRVSRSHLNAVEELLWTTRWKSNSTISRGRSLPGINKDVDWLVKSPSQRLFLEIKFRESSWSRLHNSSPISSEEDFLKKAAPKFPIKMEPDSVHVVGITVYEKFRALDVQSLASELRAYPQIHVVVVCTMAEMTYVFSLRHHSYRHRLVRNRLQRANLDESPKTLGVIYAVKPPDLISNQIQSDEDLIPVGLIPDLEVTNIPPIGHKKIHDPGNYRLEILTRGIEDEPEYKVIPQYLEKGGS